MPLPTQVISDFQEIATLAATVTNAHSSAIFLPTDLFNQHSTSQTSWSPPQNELKNRDTIRLHHVVDQGTEQRRGSIDLIAVRSQSKLVRDCRLQVGSGLLGWVAEQGRPIHLTPFEVGSQAVGIYLDNEPIKSLVALPIQTNLTTSTHPSPYGVLMCDSLRADSFTNDHIKTLEQIAKLIQRLIYWTLQRSQSAHSETSWEHFQHKTVALGDAIGADSIEVLRLRIESSGELERSVGLSETVRHVEQFFRLAHQALPPHFPHTRLPTGEMIICVDNMMSAFFQQKLQTLANHLHSTRKPMRVAIQNFSARLSANGHCDLDATLQQEPLTTKTSSNIGGVRG